MWGDPFPSQTVHKTRRQGAGGKGNLVQRLEGIVVVRFDSQQR
jgi:hypothetical protein